MTRRPPCACSRLLLLLLRLMVSLVHVPPQSFRMRWQWLLGLIKALVTGREGVSTFIIVTRLHAPGSRAGSCSGAGDSRRHDACTAASLLLQDCKRRYRILSLRCAVVLQNSKRGRMECQCCKTRCNVVEVRRTPKGQLVSPVGDLKEGRGAPYSSRLPERAAAIKSRSNQKIDIQLLFHRLYCCSVVFGSKRSKDCGGAAPPSIYVCTIHSLSIQFNGCLDTDGT